MGDVLLENIVMTPRTPFLVRIRTRAYWTWPRLMLAAVAVLLWTGFLFYPRGAAPTFVTAAVTRGPLVVTVSATGTLQPENQVDVGAEISGRVDSVLVDFNDPVKKGQLIAVINTDALKAQLAQAQATLGQARATLQNNQATVAQTLAKKNRYHNLQAAGAVAIQDVQTADADYARAVATVAQARASIQSAQAQIVTTETSLAKAQVRSPIDGVVLDRKISTGQTVASNFQTPVLFTLASNLSRMQLAVDIDEADIGAVREGQQASFVVDAFAQRRFNARLVSLHNASTTDNGVVTYRGVLSVDNRSGLLRPGLTATAEILVADIKDALLVPNGSLRFTPSPSLVKAIPPDPSAPNGQQTGRVWVLKQNILEARDLILGRSNGRLTQILSGNLAAGEAVVTDLASKTTPGSGAP